MKLGILSDTHDELDRTKTAVDALLSAGAEALVHCGDLASPPILEICAVRPCWFVFGNHDADVASQLRLAAVSLGVTCLDWGGIFDLASRQIGVTHGHMTADVRRVVAAKPDYLLSGHSHQFSDTLQSGVRRINPGALFRADVFTVALLDLVTDECRWLTVDS